MRRLQKLFLFLAFFSLSFTFACVSLGSEAKAGECTSTCPPETIQSAFPDCKCMGVRVNETTNKTEYYYAKKECKSECLEDEKQMPYPDCACLPLSVFGEENETVEKNEIIAVEVEKTNAWKQLYKLGEVKSYEYERRRIEGNESVLIGKISVNSSVVSLNGKNVLLLEVKDGARTWSEWRELQFYECAKRVETKKYLGKKISEEQPCPASNEYWNYFTPGYNASVQLKEVGREKINTSSGEETVVAYEVSGVEGVKILKNANTLVPEKIVNKNTKTETMLIVQS